MPTYEYWCATCRRKVAIFYRSMTAAREADPRCPRCEGKSLERRVSRVAVLRSEESRLDALADPSALAGLDENDPQSLARFMRKMSAETGEGLDGEFEEVCSRLESGESPDAIEKSMGMDGDGGADGGGGAGDDSP